MPGVQEQEAGVMKMGASSLYTVQCVGASIANGTQRQMGYAVSTGAAGFHQESPEAGVSLLLPLVRSQHLLSITRGDRKDLDSTSVATSQQNLRFYSFPSHSAAPVWVSLPCPHTWLPAASHVPTAASGGSMGALWEISLWELSLFIRVMMAQTQGMHL